MRVFLVLANELVVLQDELNQLGLHLDEGLLQRVEIFLILAVSSPTCLVPCSPPGLLLGDDVGPRFSIPDSSLKLGLVLPVLAP